MPLGNDQGAATRNYFNGCLDHTGADVLQHIGTREAVYDIETLRQALGEPSLTAVAYSYGTKVAALYAEKFPGHIRAIVFDGVVDLSEDDATMLINQARSFQQTFERFVAYCRKEMSCPFEGEVSETVRTFHGLLASRGSGGRQTTHDTKEIGAPEILEAVQFNLLWPDRWANLISALEHLKRGNATWMESLVAEIRQLSDPDSSIVINCADTAWHPNGRGFSWERAKEIEEAAPFSNMPSNDTELGGCRFWPFPGTDIPHVPEWDTRWRFPDWTNASMRKLWIICWPRTSQEPTKSVR
jgi:alpha/beta hydrolase family protein